MGKTTTITDETARFIAQQHVFFVATAPLAADGRINLSPKGLDTFVIIDPSTAAYLDLTGSGIETIAHLRENGRIVVMFCAFEGGPKILRLHGRGESVTPNDARFAGLVAKFPPREGVRSVILVHVNRVADTCGFGVPLMEFKGERRRLDEWVQKKGDTGLKQYRLDKNRVSIDGLPGLEESQA